MKLTIEREPTYCRFSFEIQSVDMIGEPSDVKLLSQFRVHSLLHYPDTTFHTKCDKITVYAVWTVTEFDYHKAERKAQDIQRMASELITDHQKWIAYRDIAALSE